MPVDTTLDAILPAGGRLKGGFATEAGAHVKALISFNGRTILERTVEALRETGRVRRVVVMGPEDLSGHPAARGADAVLPDAGSAPNNILRGLQWLRETDNTTRAERALVLTTDLPFLTPEGICTLLDLCPSEAEVAAPAIRGDEFEASFPGTRRRYARLRDGEYLIGGGRSGKGPRYAFWARSTGRGGTIPTGHVRFTRRELRGRCHAGC